MTNPRRRAVALRFGRFALSSVLLLLVVLGGTVGALSPARAEEGSDRSETRAPDAGDPVRYAFEAGGVLGKYLDDGSTDAQFLGFIVTRPAVHALRLDLGRQRRFGESSLGVGAAYSRFLEGGTTLGAGIATGEGDLSPRYQADLWVAHPVLTFGLTLGYTRYESKEESGFDAFGIGLDRWFRRWIVAGNYRHTLGRPGNTTTRSGGASLTYYVYRKTYVGVGVDWADINYLLVRPANARVGYTGRGYHAHFSRWVTDDAGFNVRMDYGDPPEVIAATVSVFREW